MRRSVDHRAKIGVMFWIIIGLATYLGTAALGTSAQLGWVNTHPFRWAHHVLFAAVWLTLFAVLWSAWGQPWFWLIVPIAVCMAILPRFRAGTRPHCASATVGLVFYIGAFLWAFVATR